jgi:hypothetical protein
MLKNGPLTKPEGFHATADASSATATNAASAAARLPRLSRLCAGAIAGNDSATRVRAPLYRFFNINRDFE